MLRSNAHKSSIVLGLRGKVLVVGGGYRGGFCGKLLEASLCPIEPMPASSKTDPPLAKAEPISNSGSASGITYLRKGKKLQGSSSCSQRERSEKM